MDFRLSEAQRAFQDTVRAFARREPANRGARGLSAVRIAAAGDDPRVQARIAGFPELLDAQMSAPCAAALALVGDEVMASSFLPESLARPGVQALIQRIDTRVDEECERIYPGKRSGAVHIVMRDGAKLSRRVMDPLGEAANPMSDADLEGKFTANCEPVIRGAGFTHPAMTGASCQVRLRWAPHNGLESVFPPPAIG